MKSRINPTTKSVPASNGPVSQENGASSVVTVYCLLCKTLKDSTESFRTGFVRVNDANVPMGICREHGPSERLAIQSKMSLGNVDKPAP